MKLFHFAFLALFVVTGCSVFQQKRYSEQPYPATQFPNQKNIYGVDVSDPYYTPTGNYSGRVYEQQTYYYTTEQCPYNRECYDYNDEKVVYQGTTMPTGSNPLDPTFVIMQHPIRGDFVRCPIKNTSCIYESEKNGYVASHALPYMAGGQSGYGYPGGKWVGGESAPRW